MLTVIFAALLLGLSQASDWNYDDATGHGPSSWYKSYPTCGGVSQSPINILTDNLAKGVTLGPMKLYYYDIVWGSNFNVTNTGHGVQINIPNTLPTFEDNGLRGKYSLEQIHFHWSQTDGQGSEHLLDGKSHSMEIHMVHFSSEKYTSVSEARQDSQGLAVLAIFVDIDNASPQQNQAVAAISTRLSAVTNPGQFTTTAPFAMQDLLPKNSEYYRYQGSLTTPGCDESIMWTVFKDPIYISQAQMNAFRSVYGKEGKPLQHNDRPTQPLNNREVKLGK